MPRLLVSLLACALWAGAVSAQPDVLSTLGTNLREAQDSIFSTFTTGVAALAGEASVFKAATPDQRASIVRGVVAVARAFAGSADFRARYREWRESQKPALDDQPGTADEALAAQQAAIDESVKGAMAAAAQMSPEMRKELEQNIAEMRKQLAELNADPEYKAQLDAVTAEGLKEARAEHARKLAAWEAEYPEDVNTLIARRLRQFLTACGDVDFEAKVQADKDKRYRFVNPAYEQRSAEWKLCYRAGRPAVDAARAAATEWLKSLP